MGKQRVGVLRSGGVVMVVVTTGHQLLAPAVRPPQILSAGCGIQKTNFIEPSEEGLVSEEEFPWVVALQDSRYTHLAFGSILSEFWILSIASAFQNRPVPLPVGLHSPPWGGLVGSASCSAWAGLEGGFLMTGQQCLLCCESQSPEITRCQRWSSPESSPAQ